jgi:allophanate hydrolase subunit 1
VRQVGERALLLEVDEPGRWYPTLRAARERGELICVDIVPGAKTILVDGVPDPAEARLVISRLRPGDVLTQVREVEIPVHWDGADLAGIPWDAPAVLTQTVFTVAFCGFAPGFAYLAGLPERLHLPRRASPRLRVPAGSVATAGPYVGVYPRETPGGWSLLGHTDVVLFDPDRDPPALLTPGTTVRFVDA